MYKVIKSVTGKFRLAYSVGDVIDCKGMKAELKQTLIDGKYITPHKVAKKPRTEKR